MYYGMMEKDDFTKAYETLNKGLKYLEKSDIMNQGKIRRLFKIQQANTELKMLKPSKGLNILKDKNFAKEKQQPASYYFVQGDC